MNDIRPLYAKPARGRIRGYICFSAVPAYVFSFQRSKHVKAAARRRGPCYIFSMLYPSKVNKDNLIFPILTAARGNVKRLILSHCVSLLYAAVITFSVHRDAGRGMGKARQRKGRRFFRRPFRCLLCICTLFYFVVSFSFSAAGAVSARREPARLRPRRSRFRRCGGWRRSPWPPRRVFRPPSWR